MKKGVYSATVVGAVVEESIAKAFAEKCAPHGSAEALAAFIHGVVDGEISFHLVPRERLRPTPPDKAGKGI